MNGVQRSAPNPRTGRMDARTILGRILYSEETVRILNVIQRSTVVLVLKGANTSWLKRYLSEANAAHESRIPNPKKKYPALYKSFAAMNNCTKPRTASTVTPSFESRNLGRLIVPSVTKRRFRNRSPKRTEIRCQFFTGILKILLSSENQFLIFAIGFLYVFSAGMTVSSGFCSVSIRFCINGSSLIRR